jgi:plastocyanin
MRRAWFAIAATALALPAAAVAMEMHEASSPGPEVSILFGSVTPVKVDVVAGETVHWSNDSVRAHTVTADDGAYDSGNLGPNEHFDRMFDTAGTYTYHCRLHPYIRGEIDVHTLLLERPSQPAAPGRPYPVTGRAAVAPGTPVAIEFDDGSGAWRKVAETSVGSDGAFAAQVSPSTSGSYRAVAGSDTSPAVDLLVLNRVVSGRARAVRGGSRISVGVSPASPGATVVLQLYLKDHFGWWPVAKHRLGKDSRTVFSLRHRRAVSARVVITLPDGATVIGTSRKLGLHTH